MEEKINELNKLKKTNKTLKITVLISIIILVIYFIVIYIVVINPYSEKIIVNDGGRRTEAVLLKDNIYLMNHLHHI